MTDTSTNSSKLSFKKPFPPFDGPKPIPKGIAKDAKAPESIHFIDYISKEHFKAVRPKSNDELHDSLWVPPTGRLQRHGEGGLESLLWKKKWNASCLCMSTPPPRDRNQTMLLNDIAKILPKCKPKNLRLQKWLSERFTILWALLWWKSPRGHITWVTTAWTVTLPYTDSFYGPLRCARI